jgi:hypothetical protein
MTRVLFWLVAPLLFAVGVARLLAYVEGRS